MYQVSRERVFVEVDGTPLAVNWANKPVDLFEIAAHTGGKVVRLIGYDGVSYPRRKAVAFYKPLGQYVALRDDGRIAPLSALRRLKGFTQDQLCVACRLSGVLLLQPQLSDFENGRRLLTGSAAGLVVCIADALGVHPRDLLEIPYQVH